MIQIRDNMREIYLFGEGKFACAIQASFCLLWFETTMDGERKGVC